jgi:hypothetical protein
MVVVVSVTGCVTSTAHRLRLDGNPLRQQAEACEARCGRLAEPDGDGYARCLDSCPGATAVDGASCPDPPVPDEVCVTSSKANPGGIAGGTVAVASGVTVVLVVVGLASLPVWVLVLLIAAH